MNENPNRTQITLKPFLLATSLIGAGIGCYLIGFKMFANYDPDRASWLTTLTTFLATVQVLGAGPLIGAGILTPFGRAQDGAKMGFVVPVGIYLIYLGDKPHAHFGQPWVTWTVALVLVFAPRVIVWITQRIRRSPTKTRPD